MKISILGTNGFLSTAIAKYSNTKGWTLDMYGLDEPKGHKYDHFYKVNLMDAELDCSGLLESDIVVYAIGAGIQSNLKEGFILSRKMISSKQHLLHLMTMQSASEC